MAPNPTIRRALLLALLASGCATSQNYLDPKGPSYAGQYAGTPRTEPAERRWRVVTFNIEHGRRISEAIAALRTYPPLFLPDALCLQEMDGAGVERIALALGLNYAYYPISRENGRDFGNAVLSPWPIEESWKVALPHTSRFLRRARAGVAARLRSGTRSLLVYSIHLGSPLGISGTQRRQQAQAILADLAGRPGEAVVAGDTNSKSVGELFVAAGMAWPTRQVGGTRGRFSFDHVFARGLVPALPPSAGVVREAEHVSDHRPVWALLRLP